MNKFLIRIYPLTVALFILFGCEHLLGNDTLKLSVQHVKVESWLNLMPGGAGSFNFAGEMSIKNSGTCKIDCLSLTRISVLQKNIKIYSIVPAFKSKTEGENHELEKGAEKEFIFYTQPGEKIKNELNTDLPIKLILVWTDSNSIFTYEIENIKVEKVY